jgi:xylulokinase
MRRHGITPAEIRLVGGGAKSAVWRQIVADVFACPVVCPEATEAGALGAALQALWCFRNHSGNSSALEDICRDYVSLDESTRALPQTEQTILYDQIYTRYLKLNETMKDVY